MWTHFWDMHSGGGTKERWAHIYIEAPEDEAKVVFYNRFGHSADRVSCTCCGEDYSTSEYATLEEATDYQRNQYNSNGDRIKVSLPDYIGQRDVLVIPAESITPDERTGTVPAQGYVWMD